MKDSKTPVLIGTGVTLLFIPLNWLFMKPLGLGFRGLALATTFAAILHMAVMLAVLRRRLGGIEGGRMAVSLGKTLLASAVAAAACWAVKAALDSLFAGTEGHVKMHAAVTLGA